MQTDIIRSHPGGIDKIRELKKQQAAAARSQVRSARACLVTTAVLLCLLWFNAPSTVEETHKALALLLAILCLLPWYLWFRGTTRSLPFIELVGLHYFLVLSLPVFIGPIKCPGLITPVAITGDDLTRALWVSIAGVSCILIAYYSFRPAVWRLLPKFELDEDRTILLCLYYLAASMFGPFVVPGLPAGLAKAGELLFGTNACVAVYALSVFFYSGKLSFTQQKLFFAGFGMLTIVNLASGWLHLVAYPVLAFLLGEMHLRKRLPLTKILILALAFMVLEVAKEEFRREDWAGATMGREVSSLSESFDTAARWTSFAPKSVDQLTEGSTDRILRRVSHLGFMADVARKTPDHIGYLMGYTYKSIPAMIVPRILWPEKPSTMDINNYLVVKYEWLPPFLVGKVAVSPGLMDEAFMNFGLTGVVFVMLTLGIFIRWLTTNLGDPQKGFGWQLALIGFMTSGGLMVTWTAQSYLAGLWQTVVFIAALYWPARKRHKKKKSEVKIRNPNIEIRNKSK